MIASRERWFFLQVTLVVLALSGPGAADAVAYGTYTDCSSCHDGFLGGLGAPLHDLHLTLTTDCFACHVFPGDVPNVKLTNNTGCAGCHGRSEDDIGQPLGGLGAGLRLHHAASGVATCATCHVADPAPVGEDVLPPFYASLGLDPSVDHLDNDGDLLVDAADPDFSSGNLPPIVVAGGPYSAIVGQPVMFDASGTVDPEGDTLIYLWGFGDGTQPPFPSQDPTASHTYATAGEYTAQLAVTDGTNDPVLVDVPVSIIEENLPPIVDAGGPYSGQVGQPVMLDASNTVDPDGDALVYLWGFGDGSPFSFPSQDPTASHTYATAGEYTAQLTVTDGVNDPVLVDVPVSITDSPPPPDGDVWKLIRPYSFDELTVRFEPFAGILLVDITQPTGASSFGIGIELGDFLFWMDITGALYIGYVDRAAGTMAGIAFGGPGGGGLWFAEQL